MKEKFTEEKGGSGKLPQRELLIQRVFDGEFDLLGEPVLGKDFLPNELVTHLKELNETRELFRAYRKAIPSINPKFLEETVRKVTLDVCQGETQELGWPGEGTKKSNPFGFGDNVMRWGLLVAGLTVFFVIGFVVSSSLDRAEKLEAARDSDGIKRKVIENLDERLRVRKIEWSQSDR